MYSNNVRVEPFDKPIPDLVFTSWNPIWQTASNRKNIFLAWLFTSPNASLILVFARHHLEVYFSTTSLGISSRRC